jgi:hypothetical protein
VRHIAASLNWAQPTQAVAGSGGVEATAAATAAMALASKIVRCSSGMIIWHRGTCSRQFISTTLNLRARTYQAWIARLLGA